MQKNQSAMWYLILAILIFIFVSTFANNVPTTQTHEITYSAFLEKLDNGEFKSIEIGNDYLYAIPIQQPETKADEQKQQSSELNPFTLGFNAPQKPLLRYKVLTPEDNNLVQRIENSGV